MIYIPHQMQSLTDMTSLDIVTCIILNKPDIPYFRDNALYFGFHQVAQVQPELQDMDHQYREYGLPTNPCIADSLRTLRMMGVLDFDPSYVNQKIAEEKKSLLIHLLEEEHGQGIVEEFRGLAQRVWKEAASYQVTLFHVA